MNLLPLSATILALLLSHSVVNAQKYEQESRIKADELPASILVYLDQHYPERCKVRHYEEYSKPAEKSVVRRYYESKFDADGYRYSVKFDSSGSLYDTERLISANQMPDSILHEIRKDLALFFHKYRIVKIQEILDQSGLVQGYELVARGKREKNLGYFELQYSATAKRLSAALIQESLNPFFFF